MEIFGGFGKCLYFCTRFWEIQLLLATKERVLWKILHKQLLVLLVCLCKIFQRTLSLVAKRSCISQKRVQKYKYFPKPPNISKKKFIFTLLFNTYKQTVGILRLFSPILAKRQGISLNAEKNHFYVKIKQKPRKMKL